MPSKAVLSSRNVAVPPLTLAGEIVVPPDPRGLMIFADASDPLQIVGISRKLEQLN